MSMDDTEQDGATVPPQGRFDPNRLSNPQVFLLSMIIFLVIVGFVAAILFRHISTAFMSNPGLNGLIFGVLFVGIILVFQQVIGLFREVGWVNTYRSGDALMAARRDPVLLAPMRALLSRHEARSLSTLSTRTILDSIATRLDEQRDISRYLTGLLVFLGLLGTFWGLLQTIGSIGATIQSLDPGAGDANDILDALKAGLNAPLEGMGTAFSSSLFGLSGSLVLGFLDLQAGRAQNRFYTELENWLSSVTDLQSGVPSLRAGADTSADMKTVAEALKSMQSGAGGNQRATAAMANLAEGIQGLVRNMRSEQQMMRDWVESQSEEQKAIRRTLDRLSAAIEKNDGGR
ncbi:flagellar motor protein MotA [Oricola sp.]|uniref:flagellar motor protein MotA n=1 Tax=Oricola sp. TaxID=1979950 RepID=UPI0025D8838C|nr:flagellar motor protein MotA [Oricola sp.]MCI5074653.1 flagellar motor protein MotA [Oricola sp.]